MKERGLENRFLERLSWDGRIPFDLKELKQIAFCTDFSGRAEQKVEEFLSGIVFPLLEKNKELLDDTGEVRV